jgi:hypothetical protein
MSTFQDLMTKLKAIAPNNPQELRDFLKASLFYVEINH